MGDQSASWWVLEAGEATSAGQHVISPTVKRAPNAYSCPSSSDGEQRERGPSTPSALPTCLRLKELGRWLDLKTALRHWIERIMDGSGAQRHPSHPS